VISSIHTIQSIEFMKKRNYFHLLYIDSPVSKRYSNFLEKNPHLKDKVSLENFCLVDDFIFYNTQLDKCIERSKMRIVNRKSLEDLKKDIQTNNCFTILKFRPSFQ
jgi:hypothetical protein